MAYLAQQEGNEDQQQMQSVSITETGAVNKLTGDENALYSLGNKRKLLGDDGLPLPKPKKSAISQ